MRESLKDLINKTYILRYKLPISSIKKTSITTLEDYCIDSTSQNDVSESIYFSIVDYCLNETEIDITKLDVHQMYAIENRLRYSDDDSLETKLKYGFFGETLLNILLVSFFGANKIIAKGIFYSPIENSENKGYDAFHFIQDDLGKVEFWFGEAKMHKSITQAISSVLKNINKSLSQKYYERNVRAILSRVNDIDHSKCTPLFNEIYTRLKNEKVKLNQILSEKGLNVVYPVLLAYDETSSTYDIKIQNTISTIESSLSKIGLINEIKAEIIFMFLPLNDVISIKKDVLQWIIEKKSMI
jgi:hypothetical protein